MDAKPVLQYQGPTLKGHSRLHREEIRHEERRTLAPKPNFRAISLRAKLQSSVSTVYRQSIGFRILPDRFDSAQGAIEYGLVE